MSNTTEPTDQEITAAFRAARIPARYHGQDTGMQTLQSKAAASFRAFLSADNGASFRSGAVVEIPFDNREAMDICFFAARFLLLHQTSVLVLSLDELARRLHARDDNFKEVLEDTDCLVILGAMSRKRLPAAEDVLVQVEWFLRRWMLNGRGLVLQGECGLATSGTFSQGFMSVAHHQPTFLSLPA